MNNSYYGAIVLLALAVVGAGCAVLPPAPAAPVVQQESKSALVAARLEVQDYPDRAAAHYRLAVELAPLLPALASREYIRSIRLGLPGELRQEAYYRLGQLALAAKSYQQAQVYFAKVLESDQGNDLEAESRRLIKQIDQDQRNREQSSQLQSEALADRALGLIRRGDYKLATELLVEANALYPYNATALTLLGYVLYREGSMAAAIPYLRQSRGVDPGERFTYYLLGISAYGVGDFREAIFNLDKAARKNTKIDLVDLSAKAASTLAQARASLHSAKSGSRSHFANDTAASKIWAAAAVPQLLYFVDLEAAPAELNRAALKDSLAMLARPQAILPFLQYPPNTSNLLVPPQLLEQADHLLFLRAEQAEFAQPVIRLEIWRASDNQVLYARTFLLAPKMSNDLVESIINDIISRY